MTDSPYPTVSEDLPLARGPDGLVHYDTCIKQTYTITLCEWQGRLPVYLGSRGIQRIYQTSKPVVVTCVQCLGRVEAWDNCVNGPGAGT